MSKSDGKAIAPEGQVWVCALCGRRAKSRWGFDAENNSTTLDHGYDSSCMLHAVLCFEERGPDGSWRKVGELSSLTVTVKLDPEPEPGQTPKYTPPTMRELTDPAEIARLHALFDPT